MVKIRITVEGGVIRDIQGIPENYTIEIIDYDVSRRDPPDLSTDENRRMCVISEWPANQSTASK